jgi:Leucine-rich repeat (LRR) protein
LYAWLGEFDTPGVLDLGGNPLTHLPASLGALTGVRFLYLKDNAFTELPEPARRLTHLLHPPL